MVIDTRNDLTVQPGSVVSRTVVKNGGGSVTLCAFDQGQSLSEHTAPFDALFHCLEGAFTVTIGGTPHVLSGGAMVLMPGGIPHAVNADRPSKCLLVMLRTAV